MSLWNTTDGILHWEDLYEPLIDILGLSLTFGLIAMMVGAIIWHYDESGYGVAGYIFIIGILGSIFPSEIRFLFGILAAMGFGMVIYRYYKPRGQL